MFSKTCPLIQIIQFDINYLCAYGHMISSLVDHQTVLYDP